MAIGALAAGGLGGLLGMIAGGQKDVASSSGVSGVDLKPESQLEQAATADILSRFRQLGSLVDAGPGQDSITSSNAANNSLAKLLEQFAAGGFLPGQADFDTASQFAQQAFQPRQVALDQSFSDAQTQTNRLAATLNRPINDPILQAKLQQERIRQQQSLSAEQGAFSSQFAQALPMQRLGFTAQLADLRGNLASQAMANRQALLGLGQSIQGGERSFRLQASNHFSNSSQESGGGLKGAISGGLAGFGTGLSAMNAFNSIGAAAPMAAPAAAPATQPGMTFGRQFGFMKPFAQ